MTVACGKAVSVGVERTAEPERDEEPFGEEQVPDSPRERYLEFGVTFLLAFAALMSAWSAYQAQSFSGQQNETSARASRLQVESLREDSRAGRQQLADLGAFQLWFDLATRGEAAAADRVRSKVRAEFRPAFDAWLATDPLSNPAGAASPFELGEYRLFSATEAQRLREEAVRLAAVAEAKDHVADQYVLTVVLFGISLFLLGVQGRIGIFELRASLVGSAGVVVIGTLLWMAVSLPVTWP